MNSDRPTVPPVARFPRLPWVLARGAVAPVARTPLVSDGAAAAIRDALWGRPGAALVSRIGAVEGLATYRFMNYGFINPALRRQLALNAGFYYSSRSELRSFCELNCSALQGSSVVASWDSQGQAALLDRLGGACPTVALRSLEPFWPGGDWVAARPGLRVAVVSPFVETMAVQVRVLAQVHPQWHTGGVMFSFVRSPLTNGEYVRAPGEPSWMERVHEMRAQVLAQRPDLVLAGAGAYGLALGELLRRDGLKVVIVGGALQLLFGISGRRWTERPEYAALLNAHWVSPSQGERPRGFQSIEGGCYW
jgi:hypothetical protein